MPSHTIHLVIAEQYQRKHPEEILDLEEFKKGTIAPDLAENKTISHYGEDRTEIDLKKYLQTHEVKQDYEKGYFLHLLSDLIFYKEVFAKETKQAEERDDTFYWDYDIVNKPLLEKYEIVIPKVVQKYARIKEGKTKYLTLEKIIAFIEEMANRKIEEQVEKIKEKKQEEKNEYFC